MPVNNETQSGSIETLSKGLKLPVIAAPMFLVSGPELVLACCHEGIIGTFPALNERSSEGFESWLQQIKTDLASAGRGTRNFGVNLIVHKSNPRLQADLELCVKHEVPLVITSLGAVADVVDAIHSYGGVVFHDVINLRHAQKAGAAGVDGLIAVGAGAGGHAGTMSPFALVNEIRRFYSGQIILSGCLSTGRDIATARMLGADYAYMGTRFINTRESRAVADYQDMISQSAAADIVYTDKVSGVYANFLKASLQATGMLDTPADPDKHKNIDFGEELQPPEDDADSAWRDIWSAGQGVGSITDSPTVATLVSQLSDEFTTACEQHHKTSAQFGR